MKIKSSAYYQREYRKRLREQGLVKKEVWIRPENGRYLADIEKQLRTTVESGVEQGVAEMTGELRIWTTKTLCNSLKDSELFSSGQASLELIDGVEPTVHITMHEFGDLPVFLTVSGEQILVESVLWSLEEVNDVAKFNDAVLRTHKYFPLSTISLEASLSGRDYYYMFGALSSASILRNVVLEIEVLANNVIQATQAYAEFLVFSTEAKGV
jgi:uncharacterized protein YjfI (DUF2170 family)